MSWENTIKKENTQDEELEDFMMLIDTNLKKYADTKERKYLKIIKKIVQEKIESHLVEEARQDLLGRLS